MRRSELPGSDPERGLTPAVSRSANRTIKTPASRLVQRARDSDPPPMGFDTLTESFASSGAATDGLLPIRVLWQLSNA